MKKSTTTTLLSLALAGVMAIPTFALNSFDSPLGLTSDGLISTADGLISPTAVDKPNYTVQVDGKAPADINVCMTVPLRTIAEQLGFKVTW